MTNFPLVAGVPQWMGWVYGAIAAVAAVTDYRKGKIYNWLTLPALGLGFAGAAFGGGTALLSAFAGVALAAAIFVPLFLAGIFGGGDVKLVMALGTVLGARGVFELTCVSILLASAGALVLLFVHRRVRAFARELMRFFSTLVTPGLSAEWPKLRRDIKAPFGIAIFLALLYVLAGGAL